MTVTPDVLEDFLGGLSADEVVEYEDLDIANIMGVEPTTGGYRGEGIKAGARVGTLENQMSKEEGWAPNVAQTLIEGQGYSRDLREGAEKDIKAGITEEQLTEHADFLEGSPDAVFGLGFSARRAAQKEQGEEALARADEIASAEANKDLEVTNGIVAQMDNLNLTNQQGEENAAIR